MQVEIEKRYERIKKNKYIDFIGTYAAAYKKEYGQRGQIVKAKFDPKTGNVKFYQVKIVVDESMIRPEEEEAWDYQQDV